MSRTAIAIILCLVCTSTVNAQWAGIYVSYWDTEEFGDAYGIGGLAHWPISDHLAVEGRGTWYLDFGDREGEEIEPASLGIGPALYTTFGESWTAYGSLIGSMFVYNRDVVVAGQEVVDDGGVEFGVTFAGGLRAEISSSWSVFAEVHYTMLSVDTKGVSDGEVVDETIDFDGPGVDLGIGFAW